MAGGNAGYTCDIGGDCSEGGNGGGGGGVGTGIISVDAVLAGCTNTTNDHKNILCLESTTTGGVETILVRVTTLASSFGGRQFNQKVSSLFFLGLCREYTAPLGPRTCGGSWLTPRVLQSSWASALP